MTCPIKINIVGGVALREFNYKGTLFSLEEAVAIEGFKGYIIRRDGVTETVPTVINYDHKGHLLPVKAVMFETQNNQKEEKNVRTEKPK